MHASRQMLIRVTAGARRYIYRDGDALTAFYLLTPSAEYK